MGANDYWISFSGRDLVKQIDARRRPGESRGACAKRLLGDYLAELEAEPKAGAVRLTAAERRAVRAIAEKV